MGLPLKPVLLWALWISILGAGSLGLASYGGTPGEVAPTPPHWPGGSLAQSATGATLVLMLHPRCSCSQATLSEFERLLSALDEIPRTYAVFFVPEGADEDWAHGALWERASSMEGVVPRVDVAGRIAASFGGLTSGHIAVYDEEGLLRFTGGLTSSRGHEGMSDGWVHARDAINTVAPPRQHPPAAANVYGCPIQGTAE